MKFVCALLIFGTQVGLAQETPSVPPPPMPAYMQKYKKRNPPPAPGANSKLQKQQASPRQAAPGQKFLEKKNENLKIQQKDLQSVTPKAHAQEPIGAKSEKPISETAQPEIDEPKLIEPEVDVESSASHTEKAPMPAAQVTETIKKDVRVPSSNKSFKSGMHVFAKTCAMQAEPDPASGIQGKVRKGRKLWVEKHSEDWHKVYKKAGAVYVSADCL